MTMQMKLNEYTVVKKEKENVRKTNSYKFIFYFFLKTNN